MRGYNCDMCGKWFTTMVQFGVLREVFDDEFDDDIRHNSIIYRPYDLCPECLRKVVSFIKEDKNDIYSDT